MPSFFSRFKHYDLPLLISTVLLLILSLAVIYGISVSSESLGLFWRQLVFIAIAGVAFFIFSVYNYHTLSRVNRIAYIVLILSLVGLLLFGREVRGSVRWIDIGFFNLQPAEFAKLIVILGVGRWLYLNRGQINSVKNLFLTFLYAGIPGFLVLIEPDLGSALVIMGIWFGLLVISAMKRKYLIAFIILGLIFVGISWEFLLQDYQRTRVEVFLNPDLDPKGVGYNVRQAIIAIGNGGLTGQGIGQGLQSQLKFLPERHTDFIFASLAEEIGFIGSIFVIALYVIIFRRLIYIMKNAKDELGYYTVGGVLVLFFIQSTVNIGINLGLLPVTGITLPLISYGGSSLLVSGISLGIVQNVARQSKILRF